MTLTLIIKITVFDFVAARGICVSQTQLVQKSSRKIMRVRSLILYRDYLDFEEYCWLQLVLMTLTLKISRFKVKWILEVRDRSFRSTYRSWTIDHEPCLACKFFYDLDPEPSTQKFVLGRVPLTQRFCQCHLFVSIMKLPCVFNIWILACRWILIVLSPCWPWPWPL